jgi:delta14-sterol reductase
MSPPTTTTITTAATTTTNAKPFHYEFGGPIGALATTLSLPIVLVFLLHWTDVGHLDFAFLRPFHPLEVPPDKFWSVFCSSEVLCPSCDNWQLLANCTAGLIAWFVFQVVLERCLPCEIVEGAPIKGNNSDLNLNLRLKYRINGHLAFWVTLLVTQVGWPTWHDASESYQFGPFPLHTLLYENYAPLAFMASLLCFALSACFYETSFFAGDNVILANGGDSGNPIYDFFIGRELNPRIRDFDWKQFCELRPGLFGWMLLNMACLQEQHTRLGYVTGSMMLINIFQGIYVWDALYNERAILTTMDITTDGFGFMLVFGDMAWVPFTYSAQAKYLVQHDPHLSTPSLVAILILHVCGFLIFRGANGQKDQFRTNPKDPVVAHLQYMETKRGTKLLTSGWWGMARKINYTGDWLMGLTWCLVCGFDSIVPYFYAIYFFILLVHRSIRDDEMCHEKYGDDWVEYKKKVPYRFVPGLV